MTTNAKVQVTLEINCSSNWNDETTVAQVKKQAAREAIDELNKLVINSGSRVKVKGEAKVTVVTFDT